MLLQKNISLDQVQKHNNEIAIVTRTLQFQYCERRIALFNAKKHSILQIV